MKSNIQVFDYLSFFDWIVFATILAATLASVIWGNFRSRARGASAEDGIIDVLLMGRRLSLPLFVATLVATWYGGIFGVTQITFDYGIYNFLTQGVFWYVTYLVFALFLVDRLAKYQAITLPDLVSKLFGPRSGYVAGIFNFFNVVPIAYTISLGLFLQAMFGWDLWAGMLAGVGVVILYASTGGLRAVVFSDVIQFAVMCTAVFLVVVVSAAQFGGIDFLTASLPAGHFSVLGGNGVLETLVWGFIALSTLVDPNFYQRCFAAKSSGVAKRGILISTCVWILFDICTTTGALYARAVLPEADSGLAYLNFGIQVLPNGLRGLFLAGILATILSTLDSLLFIAGTTLTFDLGPRWMKRSVVWNHIGFLFVGILSVMMGLIFEGDIREVWKTLGSYSAGCLLFPVLIGQFFPRLISDNQFVFASSAGAVAMTVWRFFGWPNEIDGLYVGLAVTGFCLSIWPVISGLTHRGNAKRN